jgi:hypothetical protein
VPDTPASQTLSSRQLWETEQPVLCGIYLQLAAGYICLVCPIHYYTATIPFVATERGIRRRPQRPLFPAVLPCTRGICFRLDTRCCITEAPDISYWICCRQSTEQYPAGWRVAHTPYSTDWLCGLAIAFSQMLFTSTRPPAGSLAGGLWAGWLNFNP